MLLNLVEAVGCTPGVDPICDIMKVANECLVVERNLGTLHRGQPIPLLLGGSYLYIGHPMDDPHNPFVSYERLNLYQRWLVGIGEPNFARFIRRMMDRGLPGHDIRCALLYLFSSWDNFREKEMAVEKQYRPTVT